MRAITQTSCGQKASALVLRFLAAQDINLIRGPSLQSIYVASTGMDTTREWAKESMMSLQVLVAVISLAVVVLIAAGVVERRDDPTP